ncbi:hypothetical protein ACA910_004484 [Epithemia clementina (nom. ined.)]
MATTTAATQVALVTGGNRGIGKEVCRQLAQLGNYHVLLGSRSLEQGQVAANELIQSVLQQDETVRGSNNNNNGAQSPPKITPVQLDVTDVESIQRVKTLIAERHGGQLDVLINNAGINYDSWQHASTADLQNVRDTMETNLYGAWQCSMTMLPLMEKSVLPRIVMVSSGAGSLQDMSTGTTPAYSVSKAALNALTLKLSHDLAAKKRNFKVNAVCPGWISTDMGGPGGGPLKRGGASVVWAATLDEHGPTGGFFRHGQPIRW